MCIKKCIKKCIFMLYRIKKCIKKCIIHHGSFLPAPAPAPHLHLHLHLHLQEDKAKSEESTWYHEGPESLRTAREWIAGYSVPRCPARDALLCSSVL